MTENRLEKSIKINDEDFSRELYGDFDKNIKLIEEQFDVDIVSREGEIKILGKKEAIDQVDILIKKLIDIVKVEGKLTNQQIRYAITLVNQGNEDKMGGLLNDTVCITYTGKTIKPKTLGQKKYIQAMAKNDLVFGIGPAGTGKTYLAVAKAVQAFK
ncbi:PhoH family protein, partial [Senegalia sp. (in: firmicutes)]